VLNSGKRSVVGILVDTVDYEAALEFTFRAAREKRGAAISALAVHGVMTGVLNREHKFRLNHFDLLTPDGHPVRWVLNILYHTNLRERVYGPLLTLKLCAKAEADGVPIYLYGGTADIMSALVYALNYKFPKLRIVGAEPSRFRCLTPDEKADLVCRVRSSGAGMLLVGLGCPRQEIFVYEFREVLSVPIVAVGAAFPFIAGILPQAPRWMQDHGFEWLFRLVREPRRLWRRYLYLNPAYVLLVFLQVFRAWRFSTDGVPPGQERLVG
jgi:exopolysaccharide biosynthesis WecB/TagA/CpsF family protein